MIPAHVAVKDRRGGNASDLMVGRAHKAFVASRGDRICAVESLLHSKPASNFAIVNRALWVRV